MSLQLLHGDCFYQLQFVDADVDLIFIDLPYGSTGCRWDTRINLNNMWLVLECLFPNTPVIAFAQTPFDKVLGASNIQDLRYEWIWEKTHPTGHLNAKKMPMKAHENILVFGKTAVYNPQKTTGHKRKTATKRFGNGTRLQSEVYGDEVKDVSYDSTERYPRSVQVFASDKQKSKLHPTQKPVGVCEYIIKTYTNEVDTVLDFCMGAGTTGIACLNLNRNFIGIDNDKKNFDIAQERISNHEQK